MRRMLLTSDGITDKKLREELRDLAGQPFSRLRVACVVTASLAAPGDHGWLVEHLSRLRSLGWLELAVVDLNGPPALVRDRLTRADVIWVEGGNHYYLARSFARAGLTEAVTKLLDKRVYVGVSAGSMIFSRNLSEKTGRAFGDHEDLQLVRNERVTAPFGLFDWYIEPHMNSGFFHTRRSPAWLRRATAKLRFPVYALDDKSAVRVRGDVVDVVGDGQWLLLNGPDATP